MYTERKREIGIYVFLHNLWKSKNQNGAQSISLLMNISTACDESLGSNRSSELTLSTGNVQSMETEILV